MKLRCSSLPLVSQCAQAAHAPGVRIAGPRDAADLGSAVHALLAKLIETGFAAQQGDIAAVADEWQVEVKELEKLYRMGAALWAAVAGYFPDAAAEVEMSDTRDGITLTGHIDALAFHRSEVRIADHKTGRLDYDATAQLKGYAILAMAGSEMKTAWAVSLHTRKQLKDQAPARWTREELDQWWAWLVGHLNRDEYSPGPHCGICQRVHECPAGIPHVRQVGQMFLAEDPAALQLTPQRSIQLLLYAKLFVKFCERLRDGITAAVVSEGGEWSDTDGNTLTIKEEHHKEISYRHGAAILAEELGERLPDVLKVGKTKMEEIIKESTPRGHKSLAVQNVMSRLEEAGAVSTKVVEKLEYRAAPKQMGVVA